MTDDGRDEWDGSPDASEDDEQDGFEWAMSVDDVEERGPLEPGDIDPEHAAFVLLGVAVTGLVFLRLFGV